MSLLLLEAGDWESFAAIRLQALREEPQFFSSTYEKEKDFSEAEWKNWLSANDMRMFGLVDGKHLVGTSGIVTRKLDASGKSGMVVAVYINPDHRGRGYSKKLYEACVDVGIKNTLWDKIVVAHREDNEPSRRVIEHMGFIKTHEVAREWPDGVHGNEVWYRLNLEPLRKTI